MNKRIALIKSQVAIKHSKAIADRIECIQLGLPFNNMEGVTLNASAPSIELGMAKASRLAMKGLVLNNIWGNTNV
tara:strand:+ start:726 stop:950 length:225 start_codon:yes stop_codon:yes gene_type:complete